MSLTVLSKEGRIKNYLFEQPHNWMAESYCQTYNNVAAILDTILSKYDPKT